MQAWWQKAEKDHWIHEGNFGIASSEQGGCCKGCGCQTAESFNDHRHGISIRDLPGVRNLDPPYAPCDAP